MVGIDFSGGSGRKTDDFSGVLWFDTESKSLIFVRSVQMLESKVKQINTATKLNEVLYIYLLYKPCST